MKFNKKIILQDIADLINRSIIGDKQMEVKGINEIHKVEEGDITFVDVEKYYETALNSAASIIIINKKVDCPKGKALIISDNPFKDYNFLTKHFQPFVPATKMISDDAIIGKNTIIQPGVFIGHDVIIGENCIIHPHVTIYDHAIIGDNVIIHANCVIGGDAFYYNKQAGDYTLMHSCGRVILENNVEIGANTSIDKGVSGDTIIGQGTKIDNNIQIGHGVVIGKNCLLASQVGVGGKTIIEDNVILWGQVGVSKDITIGENAVVLAQSGISKSLEGNKVYFGYPAEEARSKYKELALIRRLPEIVENIYKQT